MLARLPGSLASTRLPPERSACGSRADCAEYAMQEDQKALAEKLQEACFREVPSDTVQ